MHTQANKWTAVYMHWYKHTRRNLPPVIIELSVSKAQQLSGEVHRRVEEPVEKHQPQQVVRNLKKKNKIRHLRGTVQTNIKKKPEA